MLLKNGEPFNPAEDPNGKEILELFKDKDAVFKLAKRYVKANKHPKNKGRNDIPRNFTIENNYRYHDKETNTTVDLRYYETQTDRRAGGSLIKEYGPLDTIIQQGEITIPRQKPDYIYFLICHPRQASSPFKDDKKKSLFYIEDKAQEAAQKAALARQRKMADDLIWGDESLALKKEEAASLLMSFGFPGVEELDDNQVRVELEKYAKRDHKAFITATSGATLNIRAMVQQAIDLKVIMYKESKKKWFHVAANGSPGHAIVDVRATEDKMDRIAKFLKDIDKDGHYDIISERVAERMKDPLGEEVEEVETFSQEDIDKAVQEAADKAAQQTREEVDKEIQDRIDRGVKEALSTLPQTEPPPQGPPAEEEAPQAESNTEEPKAQETTSDTLSQEPPGEPAANEKVEEPVAQ